MLMPSVSRYMTRAAVTIDQNERMIRAHELMRIHHFRHLPVVSDRDVVGVVSDRDLRLLESAASVDPHEVRVREAMTKEVLAVDPETPLDQVVEAMHARHCGSAIVVGAHGVEGIFTTTDALSALDDLLHRATE